MEACKHPYALRCADKQRWLNLESQLGKNGWKFIKGGQNQLKNTLGKTETICIKSKVSKICTFSHPLDTFIHIYTYTTTRTPQTQWKISQKHLTKIKNEQKHNLLSMRPFNKSIRIFNAYNTYTHTYINHITKHKSRKIRLYQNSMKTHKEPRSKRIDKHDVQERNNKYLWKNKRARKKRIKVKKM